MRCLEDAADQLSIDAREVDQPGGGEDLRSPYLDGDELDVKAWARDALVLALPVQILCTRRLPRPLQRLRREPQRGARSTSTSASRTAAGRKLSETPLRLT